MSNEQPSRIVDNAFNDYIHVWNGFSNGRVTAEQLESARRRYAKALADYVIGGDPDWYIKGERML